MRAWGIVPAAGSGERLGTADPKAFLPLGEMPMLARVVATLARAGLEGLVVAAPEGWEARARAVAEPCAPGTVVTVVAGGASRQESVRLGLDSVPEAAEAVVVHDAARPLVDVGMVERALAALADAAGAVCAVPMSDTPKRVDPSGLVVASLDRRYLWRAQTPQAFRTASFRLAHRRAAEDGFVGTDDAMLVERTGVPVAIVAGDERNIKVTTPADLAMAQALVSKDDA